MTEKPPQDSNSDLLADALSSLRNLIQGVGKRGDNPSDDTTTEAASVDSPHTADEPASKIEALMPSTVPRTEDEDDDIPTLHDVVYRPVERGGETNAALQNVAPTVDGSSDETVTAAVYRGPAEEPPLEIADNTPNWDPHDAVENVVLEDVDGDTLSSDGPAREADIILTLPQAESGLDAADTSLSLHLAQDTLDHFSDPAGETSWADGAEARATAPDSSSIDASAHTPSTEVEAIELMDPAPQELDSGVDGDDAAADAGDEQVMLTRHDEQAGKPFPQHDPTSESTEPASADETLQTLPWTTESMAVQVVDLIDTRLHDRVSRSLHPELAAELRLLVRELLDQWTANVKEKMRSHTDTTD